MIAALAQGWLVAFVVCSTPVLGALLLSVIGRLTGGDWGGQAERVAPATPALLILFAPLAFGLAAAFPWAAGAVGPGHAPQYLTEPLFIARGVVALAVWAAIAWGLARRRPSRLQLGLALLAHAVLVLVVGVDWVLSLQPGWMASDFGMNLAAQQIAAGAGLAALASDRATPDAQLRDLGMLVVAGMLGVAYLGFMDYLVVWYGNLPEKVGWYLARSDAAGLALVVFALAVGTLGPAALMALPRPGRRTRAKAAGACALIGLFAYQLFLLRPALGWGSLAAAMVGGLIQAAALTWTARRLGGARGEEPVHV